MSPGRCHDTQHNDTYCNKYLALRSVVLQAKFFAMDQPILLHFLFILEVTTEKLSQFPMSFREICDKNIFFDQQNIYFFESFRKIEALYDL